jgi:hypothetical protein
MKPSGVKYAVWSEHVPESGDTPQHVHELTRTERGVAEQDVGIFQTIMHRKAWIQEVRL